MRRESGLKLTIIHYVPCSLCNTFYGMEVEPYNQRHFIILPIHIPHPHKYYNPFTRTEEVAQQQQLTLTLVLRILSVLIASSCRTFIRHHTHYPGQKEEDRQPSASCDAMRPLTGHHMHGMGQVIGPNPI